MKNFKLTNAIILTTVIPVKLKFLMLYFIINTWLQEPYMSPSIFVNEMFQNDTKISLLPSCNLLCTLFISQYVKELVFWSAFVI